MQFVYFDFQLKCWLRCWRVLVARSGELIKRTEEMILSSERAFPLLSSHSSEEFVRRRSKVTRKCIQSQMSLLIDLLPRASQHHYCHPTTTEL